MTLPCNVRERTPALRVATDTLKLTETMFTAANTDTKTNVLLVQRYLLPASEKVTSGTLGCTVLPFR